jgi:hypothetical protein
LANGNANILPGLRLVPVCKCHWFNTTFELLFYYSHAPQSLLRTQWAQYALARTLLDRDIVKPPGGCSALHNSGRC